MITVLALTGSASGGLINILLVLVLVVAAILLIVAVYLIRSSRRPTNKHAYEPQAAQNYAPETPPHQGTERQQSAPDNQQEAWQRPAISQPLTAPDALKQCPFCGTDVMPGGIFCLYCGQRLPIPAPPSSPFPASRLDEPAQKPELISSSRPSVSSFDEIDEALARAVEGRPARLSGALEEQPTQQEEAVVLEKPDEQIEEAQAEPETQIEDLPAPTNEVAVEEQPTREEEAVVLERPDEQPEWEEELPAEPEMPALEVVEPVEEQPKQEEAQIEPKELLEEQSVEAEEEASPIALELPLEDQPALIEPEAAVIEEVASPEEQPEQTEEPLAEPETPVMEVVESAEEQPERTEDVVELVESVEIVEPVEEQLEQEEEDDDAIKTARLKEWIEEQPTREEEAVVIEKPIAAVAAATSAEGQVTENMVEQSGYLILSKLNGPQIKEYPLNKPHLTIGRGRNNDIVIPRDKLTSRLHAVVRYENNRYALYDEHSANGTLVNGNEIAAGVPHILQDGDTIGVGGYEFIYRTAAALIKEVAPVSTAEVSAPVNVVESTGDNHPQAQTTAEGIMTASAGSDEAEENADEGVTPGRLIAISAAQIMEARAGQPSLEQENPITPTVAPETLFEDLRFTAFHPKEVAVETWNSLLVYTYIESALESVYQDVNLLLRETDMNGGVANRVNPLLPHGTNITIIPECRGVLFNPRRVTLQWSEDWHRSIFRFSARRDLAGLSKNGRINIFAGPLLVATLRMAMLFEEQERIDPLIEDAAISTKPYRGIFASYSHHDKIVMQACQDIYRTLGFDTLLKVDQARSWQDLSASVKEGIEQAEIFQLFWSEQTAKSAYVRQEWEYALHLNRGEGFIRPVYWEVPLVKPPDTLTPFYFSYLPTYAFSSSSS